MAKTLKRQIPKPLQIHAQLSTPPFKSLCLFNTKCPKEQANVQENKGIAHCALQTGHYLSAFLLPFVLFLHAESHLTPLFISSYDFAANVIYEST